MNFKKLFYYLAAFSVIKLLIKSDIFSEETQKFIVLMIGVSVLFYCAYWVIRWSYRLSRWMLRKWDKKSFQRRRYAPLFGYRRRQVIAYAIFWIVILAHLGVSFNGANLRPPRLTLKPQDLEMRLYRYRAGLNILPDDAFERALPKDAVKITIPTPSVATQFVDERYADFVNGVHLARPTPQGRGLFCVGDRNQHCGVTFFMPVSIGVSLYIAGPAFGQSGDTQKYEPYYDYATIHNMNVLLAPSNDPTKVFFKYIAYGTGQKSNILTAGISNQSGTTTNMPGPINLSVLSAAAKTRQTWALELNISREMMNENVQKYCQELNPPPTQCPSVSDEDISLAFCDQSKDGYDQLCTTTESTGRRIPGLKDRPYSANLLPYRLPFDRLEDRAFIGLFLRYLGEDITFDPQELKFLNEIKAQIFSDYATILGLPEAGESAKDPKAIKAALIRQPQLYRFYRDRVFWQTSIMEHLGAQLSEMGFP